MKSIAAVLITAQAGSFAAGLNVRSAPAGKAKPSCQPFPDRLETYCPSDAWLDKMVQSDPDGAGKVFMDVGCNTGTDAVDWLERWGTRPNVSASWHRTADARVGEGMCSERRRWWGGSPDASRPVPKASSADPRVFCVEPMRGNLDVIRECSAKAFGRAEDPSFTVVKAAVGDRVGTARFPDAAPGEQKASLADAGSSNKTVEVNVTTVDVLMSQYGLTSLDVLTVDTEGFDPSVLLGAERTLQVVRYLLFEVHQDLSNSPWADTSLLGLVQKLDSKGLDCYWAGNLGNLSRLTGCWAEEDERRHRPTPWNNVACVRRGDIWHAVLEGFVR